MTQPTSGRRIAYLLRAKAVRLGFDLEQREASGTFSIGDLVDNVVAETLIIERGDVSIEQYEAKRP